MQTKLNIFTHINFILQLRCWGLYICIILLASCSGTRHLPKGEKLYTGAEIILKTNEKVNKKEIKTAVTEILRPEPNSNYLGFRPKLVLYQMAGVNPKSKFKKWLQKNGEAPVVLSSVKPRITAEIINSRLFNLGIFNSYTEYKIVEKKYSAKIIYTIYIHKPYIIKALVYNISNDSISKAILNEKDKTWIKAGENYSLETLENERLRIDILLKNKGYFYFTPDYLLFKADTSTVDHSITLKLTLKKDIPENAFISYKINNVTINQNFSLNNDSIENSKDTIMCQNTIFRGSKKDMNMKPELIMRSVYLHKNDIYSRDNYTITLNRLMSLGNFKFVQVKFTNSDTTAIGMLDVTILMTPMPNYTFRAEMDLISKSNNNMGPRLNMSMLNRNAFHGAELLKLNLAGSFEAQLSGANKNQFSYSMNPQLDLTFPRFWTPIKIKQSNSIYIPKTHLSLSYNYMKRVNYFDMSTYHFKYGFVWKNNLRNEHELNPVNVSNTTISNESEIFNKLLSSNPYLKKSYEEQFIAGGNYSYTYNEQAITGKKNQYYFNGLVETAGNIFSLVKIIGGQKPNSENPATILGSVYSQYVKLSVDGRAFLNFRDKNKLAMRLFAGVASSYGNSSSLPYSKQFFSGGPNSIRAFRINSVGPGNYFQQSTNTGFLQMGGDIKLEMNAEYRFNIFSFFKGALFVDAGNVWQETSNPSNIGTPFAISQFMNELAVGTGFGLRVDVSFFVLRFDLAIPLRKPWLAENERWVIKEINPLNSAWRTENLMLNIAIGYPF